MQSGKLNSLAVSFRAKTGQPSGPGDLSDLMFIIYDRRYYCNRVQYWSFSIKRKDGMELVSSWVNTLVKKSLNNLDLSLSLSVETIEPSDFSEY